MKHIVLDTNTLFSCLLKESSITRQNIFSQTEVTLHVCKFSIIELFRHKEKILKYTELPEEELLEVYYKVLKKVNIFDEAFLSVESLEQAISLCKDIDEKDAIFVAVTLELDGVLWTGDLKLKEGLAEKGFTKFYTPTPVQ